MHENRFKPTFCLQCKNWTVLIPSQKSPLFIVPLVPSLHCSRVWFLSSPSCFCCQVQLRASPAHCRWQLFIWRDGSLWTLHYAVFCVLSSFLQTALQAQSITKLLFWSFADYKGIFTVRFCIFAQMLGPSRSSAHLFPCLFSSATDPIWIKFRDEVLSEPEIPSLNLIL